MNMELNFNSDILDEIKTESSKDIAIIGMDVKLPMADNLDEFWNNLKCGKDCVGELPQNRKKDIEDYLRFRNGDINKIQYANGGYLKAIDKFDNDFFKMSNKEAKLMDPNQRIFLESAWKAIEDSGYGGKKLVGSRTGVYVGFTPRGEYRKFITDVEPESLTVAETGNLSSIIASRIAYILDFRGPSMIVNTECSSSLVAVHLACQSLRNGECEMAIAGGVRIAFSPVVTDQKLGIESEQGKVCTFDDDSDGAVFGEGSVAIILKPLDKALKDGDYVYAVIKGSAVNQDGASVGITAPNLLAQEDVIINAWKDADIDPETITYIETHGTGTKLGDPVEVNGINRAFKRWTNKKQFCGVGSLKTNIAHLDNVSGIASLVKVVLALKAKKIPPTINFNKPNRKINFEDSAVYINNRLSEWKTNGVARRCGVSSFGLSGTNCHVVLEEAPAKSEKAPSHKHFNRVFTISATKKEVGMNIAREIMRSITINKNLDFGDMCYTSNVGRGHYNFRIAIIAENVDRLAALLGEVCELGIENVGSQNILWGEHYIIPNNKLQPDKNEIYESFKKELCMNANSITDKLARDNDFFEYDQIKELCRLYVQGADVDWYQLYRSGDYSRVSFPTYLFEEKRCWLDIPVNKKNNQSTLIHTGKTYNHPLIDWLAIESVTQDIYITDFSVKKHWVLKEHNIIGKYLVPGTAYLEMARECGSRYFNGKDVEFKNVIFLNSLVVDEEDTKQIQTVIKKEEDHIEFIIVGKTDPAGTTDIKWTVYCEGKLYSVSDPVDSMVNFSTLRLKCPEKVEQSADNDQEIAKDFMFGPRWTSVTQAIYVGNEEVFAELKLPEEFIGDLDEYYLHPSMLDMAVNAITQNTGNGIYLPLSYDSFKVYGPTKKVLYSYVKRTNSSKNLETMSFKVYLFDSDKRLIADVNNLTVKKVHQEGLNSKKDENIFYHMDYLEKELEVAEPYYSKEDVLVFGGVNELSDKIILSLKNSGRRVIEVNLGTIYSKDGENHFIIRNMLEDYNRFFEEIKYQHIGQIVHLFTAGCQNEEDSMEKLEEYQQKGVISLFNIVKSIAGKQIADKIDLAVVSDKVNYVTNEQKEVNAHNAPLLGLCKVVNKEFSDITCRMVDIDQFTEEDTITTEIDSEYTDFYVAYRQGKKYTEILNIAKIGSSNNFDNYINENGVYVITGGIGGLGVQIAKCLSEVKNINIVLISRRQLPQFDNWEELLVENDKKLSDNIRIIQEIVKSGSSVKYYSADVTDADRMAFILNEVRSQHGSINGVIHTAGVAGDNYIINSTIQNFNKILSPKVYGTYILDKLTENDDLDFFVSFSSISSVYGYPGQSGYVAANSYLDSFSGYRKLKNKKTISINWAPWKQTGMAHDYNLNDDGIFKMLSVQTALEAFKLALASNLENVIIGKLNTAVITEITGQIPFKLAKEIKASVENREKNNKNSLSERNKEKDEGVSIKGKSDNDYSKTELLLAGIWGNVLGMSNVDIYSNFMDIGGDSILAVDLLKKIEKMFPGVVSISDIFSYPSVSEMAHFIDAKTNTPKKVERKSIPKAKQLTDVKDIMDVLGQLEEGTISVNEAEGILSDFEKE